jgi:hypothetical protein
MCDPLEPGQEDGVCTKQSMNAMTSNGSHVVKNAKKNKQQAMQHAA